MNRAYMWLLVCHVRAANGSWSCAYDLVFCLKFRPPVLDSARGAYVADFTDLANDITNQSREFYCGGSNTLLTREQTINKYRPKSVAVLVSLI